MKYFGTDGIRGIPNKKLNINFLPKLGFILKHFNNKICIATDTRISKDMIKNLIIGGALASGSEVIDLGIISTPALIYYSYINKIVGVMVTASHNPYTDNGIKIVNNGKKLNSDEELLIEHLIDESMFESNSIGVLYTINNPLVDYYNLLYKYITKTNYKIIIDCSNGSTYNIAPNIFPKVTNNLIILNNKPNGTNINLNCGSTNINCIRNEIIKNKYDFGFSFDGDGDRVIVVDDLGNIIDGDILVYIISLYLKKYNKLNNNKVVLSIMSNIGIIKALNNEGIEVILTDVGDKNIINELNKNNLSIGGETSGHIILPNIMNTGDGILVSLLIIKILEEYNIKFKDILSNIRLYPNKLVNIKVNNKDIVLNNQILINKIKEYSNLLGSEGKILVRASGTEDLIRIYVSAKDINIVDNYINDLSNIVKGEI